MREMKSQTKCGTTTWQMHHFFFLKKKKKKITTYIFQNHSPYFHSTNIYIH